MVKHLLVTLIGVFAILYSHAQSQIQFCVQVNKDGTCLTPSKEFDIDKAGGTISMLLKSEGGLQTDKVRYKIYMMDAAGNETLSKTIDQNTGADWNFAWMDISFYDAGSYKIKVYALKEYESFLCSEIVKIFKP